MNVYGQTSNGVNPGGAGRGGGTTAKCMNYRLKGSKHEERNGIQVLVDGAFNRIWVLDISKTGFA
jgi:hypothetical protein